MTMGTGAITGYVDVAQIVLYIFWVFFAGLIYYLVQEGKREGFPLESDRPDYKVIEGWPPVPKPKTFKLPHGGEFTAPHNRDQPQDLPARRVGNYPGSPIEPTGNPMIDGLGPAAWTNRADVPDQLIDGAAKIIPLRVTGDFNVATQDIDPRGLNVFGADGEVAGKIVDIWVDQAEMMFRYYEVEVPGGKRVLLPINFSRVSKSGVKVKSILASQFAQVPTTRNPEQVTLLEEDKIMGYFGGGTLYATPDRQEPLI
jgi:photosynthetic reaction center H subunit